MSRSKKKHFITKVKASKKDDYWKTVRKNHKQSLQTKLKENSLEEIDESLEFENPKAIINDYDYIDQVSNCEVEEECYCIKTFGRRKCKDK
jgi:hypothetical protein